MKSRAIIFYWLLLTVPALAAGALLYRLLGHEQERLANAETAQAMARAKITADDIALIVDELKDGLAESLRAMPQNDLARQLQSWEQNNPLIRDAFIWNDPARRLILPDTNNWLSAEQSGAARRYENLFASRPPWRVTAQPEQQQLAMTARQDIRKLTKGDYNSYAANYAPQTPEQLTAQNGAPITPDAQQRISEAAPQQSWSRQVPVQQIAAQQTLQIQQPASPEQGWIPLFNDDELFLLGWFRSPSVPVYYGVEVEMAALLSRVVSAMPTGAPPGQVIALLDGNGRVMNQRGGVQITPKMRTLASVSLSPQLPHWSVVIYSAASSAALATGRSFQILSGAIAATFVIAIVAGGSLLLLQARRNLREAMTKTTFVSNVSHELKTPLTTIRMYAEMLGEGRVRDDERRREYLDTMIRESQRLTRLVNNVLDFSRLEQGKKKYRNERLDLAETIRGVLATQETRLAGAGIQPLVEPCDGECFINADRDAVEQIALNLIDNAIKYAASGGRLTLRFSREGGYCRVTFSDAGPGVPAAHRERIFEQFHRVDNSLTANQPGCGLGLSIARRLARDHGGDVSYEPAPNGGSVFTLVLPEYGEGK